MPVFSGTVVGDVLENWLSLNKELTALNNRLSGARTPAEFQAISSQMQNVSMKIASSGRQLKSQGLPQEFQRIYKSAGGVGAVPKPFLDKAYRNRNKVDKSVTNMALGIDKWARASSTAQANLKAARELEKKNREIGNLVRRASGKQKEDLLAEHDKNAKRIQAMHAKSDFVGSQPSVPYHYRKALNGHTKGDIYSYQRLDNHMKLALDTGARVNANIATAAAAAKASGWVIVHDGPECGKTRHGDRPFVRGQVWTAAEAASFPIGHPGCTRSFVIAAGPPGSKKLKQQLNLLNNARTTTQKIEAIAKAAAIAGITASSLQEIVSNPFTQRFIREILGDKAADLGPTSQKFLTYLTGKFDRWEQRAIKNFGEQLDIKTGEDLERRIGSEFDEAFSNRQFIDAPRTEVIQLEPHQAQALGLRTRTTKGEFLESYDEYNDYRLSLKAEGKALEDILEDQAHYREAKDAVYDDAAIRFHLAPGEGMANHRHWGVVVRNLKKAYDASPDKANRELIRLGASLIDPFPWAKGTFGPFKFSVGMPSRARQDLVEKLFGTLTGNRRFTAQERKWAEQLGMQLAEDETWSKQDLIRAFTPRVTFDTGGLFSATLGLENGKIAPVIRARPPGIFNRIVDLEHRLSDKDIKDFIKNLREGVPLREALKSVNDNSLTAINFFRHGPFQASVRWHGLEYDNFTIKILPDNKFIRYSKRFNKGDEIIDKWKEGVEVLPHLINKITGLRWQPWSWSGQKAIATLKYMSNTLGEISKRLRVNYEWALEWFTGKKEILSEMFTATTTSLSKLGRGATWDEVKEEISTEWDAIHRREISKLRGNISSRNASDYVDSLHEVEDRIDPRLLEHPEIREDLVELKGWWDQNMPNKEFPRIRVIADENVPERFTGSPMYAGPGGIVVPQSTLDEYDTLARLRKKSVANGFLIKGADRRSATFFHEAGHYITANMSDSEYRNLLQQVIDSQDWPLSSPSGRMDVPQINLKDVLQKDGTYKPLTKLKAKREFDKWLRHPTINSMIRKRAGTYASMGTDELLSELFSEYVVSRDPSQLAQTIGRSFIRHGTLRSVPGGLGSVNAIQFSPKTVKAQEAVRAKLLSLANKWKTTAQEILEVWKKRATDILRLNRMEVVDTSVQDALDKEHMDRLLQAREHLQEEKKDASRFINRAEALHNPELGYATQRGNKALFKTVDDRLLDDNFLGEDLEELTAWWRDTFPNVPPPKIVLSEKGDAWDKSSAFMWQFDDWVVVPRKTFDSYRLERDITRNQGARTGWLAPGAEEEKIYPLIHETGHYIFRKIINDADLFQDFLKEVMGNPDIFPGFDEVMQGYLMEGETQSWRTFNFDSGDLREALDEYIFSEQGHEAIWSGVSHYGVTNHHEMFAEMFADYYTNSDPRKAASTLGKWIEANKNRL